VGSGDPAGGAAFDHANELYRVGHTLDNGFTSRAATTAPVLSIGANTYDQGVVIGPNNYFSRTRYGSRERIASPTTSSSEATWPSPTRAPSTSSAATTPTHPAGDLRTPPDFNNYPTRS